MLPNWISMRHISAAPCLYAIIAFPSSGAVSTFPATGVHTSRDSGKGMAPPLGGWPRPLTGKKLKDQRSEPSRDCHCPTCLCSPSVHLLTFGTCLPALSSNTNTNAEDSEILRYTLCCADGRNGLHIMSLCMLLILFPVRQPDARGEISLLLSISSPIAFMR